MDDKHSCKVGEPSCPVTAVERGRRLIVGTNQSFQVSDHDFAKISVTPSVALDVNIPESIDGSFYNEQVYVGLKENCFEALITELATYISLQIALIVLFLKTNVDMVLAPQHSWKDPAERIMSILNIGLQATGLMREKINNPAIEHKLKSAKNMRKIRQLANEIEGLEEGIKSSVLPVKQLLNNILWSIEIKRQNFLYY